MDMWKTRECLRKSDERWCMGREWEIWRVVDVARYWLQVERTHDECENWSKRSNSALSGDQSVGYRVATNGDGPYVSWVGCGGIASPPTLLVCQRHYLVGSYRASSSSVYSCVLCVLNFSTWARICNHRQATSFNWKLAPGQRGRFLVVTLRANVLDFEEIWILLKNFD